VLLATTPQQRAADVSPDGHGDDREDRPGGVVAGLESAAPTDARLSGLPAAIRRGWVPEPVRVLAVPPGLTAVFGAGLPRGRVSELVGAVSSGRTSLMHSLLAAATAAHEVTAVVDVPNAFDPASARRAAVNLDAVLWVRPPSARDGLRCAELILGAGGFGLVVLDLDEVPLQHLRLHSWPRLTRAAERSGAALIVLAAHRIAGSFAALSLAVTRRRVLWQRTFAGRESPVARRFDGELLLGGFATRVELTHSKLGPPGRGADVQVLASGDER
jgi:hypothetical protein